MITNEQEKNKGDNNMNDLRRNDENGRDNCCHDYYLNLLGCPGVLVAGYPCRKDEKGGCNNRFGGELLKNGDMEKFHGNKPDDWDLVDEACVDKIEKFGRVHSGKSAVGLIGSLCQKVWKIQEGCFYDFSFFARINEAYRNFMCVEATVVFNCEHGNDIVGAKVEVRAKDVVSDQEEFGYYKVITKAAPKNVKYATIILTAKPICNNEKFFVDFDDVSFSAR